MDDALAGRTIRRVFLRLMPLLLVSYFLVYSDRVGMGFAALTMNKNLGLSAYDYGLGAGLFFWGYALLAVPSNLVLVKVGARRWIFCIMLVWGILSVAMAWISGPTSFVVLRLLLGAAEAGFFPGVILYMTYWFPATYRARITAVFMVAIPTSLAIGAPVSTAILELNGAIGLRGWQWLFILEGIPTIIVAWIVLLYLPDRPRDARWLNDRERTWLDKVLASEALAISKGQPSSMWRALIDVRVLILCFIYFCNTSTNLGLAFFMPQIVAGMGLAGRQAGLIIAIPYVVGTVGILFWGFVSDRYNERRISLTLTLLVSAAGLAAAGWLGATPAAVVAMSLAASGIYGTKPPFWSLPSTFLTGSAAAGGIAMINSIGNLGGFFGPSIVGWSREMSGGFSASLYTLAAFALAASATTFLAVRWKRPGP